MALNLGYSIKALGGTLGGQWERTRRDTLFLMGAVLLSAIPQFGVQPLWISTVFLMLFCWRFGLVMSGRWVPRASVRLVAAIGCAAGVYAEYHTLIGRDPGIALLTLFLGLKLMEMQARRDLFVVIFLCFFLLLTAFFHSQSIWTGTIVLTAVFALVTAMLTIQFAQNEVAIGKRMRMTGTMLAQALPLAALMFVVFPRLQAPLWGADAADRGAKTGLSESMSPGSIASLSRSPEVAFRVRFSGDAPAREVMYWRGPILGGFDGEQWTMRERFPIKRPDPLIETRDTGQRSNYAVTLEPTGQRWLFALEAPLKIESPWDQQSHLDPNLTLLARDQIDRRIRYQMSSTTDYRLGGNETPESLRNWLELPAGFNPRTLQLAADWTQSGAGPAALVNRALHMFREEPFRYTLQPPVLGRHSVDEFLFDSRAGFCEHFSAAFVVLMRALDIPARVVTGYQGGELNEIDDYWVVRQSDAHAWAEVWLDGQGWVRIDPTGAVAPSRIESSERLSDALDSDTLGALSDVPVWRGLAQRFDALANAWNEWVLSYDGERQRRLFERIGLDFGDWRELAGVFAALSMLVIGGCALLTLHPKAPKDPIDRAWGVYCDKLAACGMARKPHETAWQYHERTRRLLEPATAAQARHIVSIYNRLRYAQDGRVDDVRDLRLSVRKFQP